MREIKFRGKRVDNGEWVEGYYFEGFTGIPYVLTLHDHILGMTNFYEVIPETVGQSTGLHDKNGVKIYEGDIVKGRNKAHESQLLVGKHGTTYNLYQIIANAKVMLSPYCRLDSRVIYDDFSCLETDLEVVGNIHDQED